MPTSSRLSRGDSAPEPLLTETQAAKYLSLTTRALQNWRYLGRGPHFVRISRRAVRYRQCDLDEFVELNIRTSTSDFGAVSGSRLA